jgi:hypothetical protein
MQETIGLPQISSSLPIGFAAMFGVFGVYWFWAKKHEKVRLLVDLNSQTRVLPVIYKNWFSANH